MLYSFLLSSIDPAFGPAPLLKRDSNTGFSCEYCKMFKNTCFEKLLGTAALKDWL